MKDQAKRVVAIIQARMGSERLPGKVLEPIAGNPMLAHVVNRTARVGGVDQVVVATTSDPADDPIAEWGLEQGHLVVRGHPIDVLDRYHQAVAVSEAEIVVRVTGDCPLLDPGVTARTLDFFRSSDPPLDFAANRLPGYRTYPIGLDTEVCSRQALISAWQNAEAAHQREHVMPYIYQSPDFAIGLIGAEADFGAERWTVDTPADLRFVRAVFDHFSPEQAFGWRDVLTLLAAKPELRQLNEGIRHRTLEETDSRFDASKEQVNQS